MCLTTRVLRVPLRVRPRPDPHPSRCLAPSPLASSSIDRASFARKNNHIDTFIVHAKLRECIGSPTTLSMDERWQPEIGQLCLGSRT